MLLGNPHCGRFIIPGPFLYLTFDFLSAVKDHVHPHTLPLSPRSAHAHQCGYHMLNSQKSRARMTLPSSSCSVKYGSHDDTNTDIQYLTLMPRGSGFPSAVRLNTAVSCAHTGALFTLLRDNGYTVAPAFCLW